MIKQVGKRKANLYMKYIVLIYAMLLVGIDQIVKVLVDQYLKPLPTVGLIENAVHLTYVENRGAAFSSFEGQYVFLVLFTSIAIFAAIVWICVSKKGTSKLLLWSMGTIIGGGIGNLLDRVLRGYVIDYIDFRIINFAVFNFADICVVCGTILLAVYILFADNGKKEATVKSSKGKA